MHNVPPIPTLLLLLHSPAADKPQFVSELARVCAPGGRVIIVTWCHRVLGPGEAGLRDEEQSLLDRICEAYYLPAWCSIADYERLFAEQGLTGEACVCVRVALSSLAPHIQLCAAELPPPPLTTPTHPPAAPHPPPRTPYPAPAGRRAHRRLV